ncbi:ATPase, T2SS/T4P/T4SS family [Candidatus Thioglobus autotrophicus]|uniref:GspE/PulE family protein n=1 Tax=Candidatus Thioglobus autotrophicus TaxID=1705394 RepID=UPI00299D94B1|nr:ATPase, T2SS/T4P/T4SS family [Candidatus Thioglobus autotrophicus]WPE16021.1 ATPase, T2SS/T4P/T4SS family [Candidatus Thioglobus autotrophicus]
MICLSKDVTAKIVSFLLDKETLTSKQLEQAKSLAIEQECCLIQVLIENNHITQERLADEISQLYDLKRVTLNKAGDVEDEAYSLLSEEFIIENNIIPFSLNKKTIKVAISDPVALSVMGNVKVLSGRKVETFVVTFKEIKDIITKRTNIQFGSTSKIKSDEIEDEEESSEIIRYVNQIIELAVSEGASDIHIEPFRKDSRLRYRVDGVLSTQSEKIMTGFSVSSESSFLHEHYAAVTTRVKIMATLDISEKRLPQDGAIVFKSKNANIDLRISVLPTNNGERVVMRILDKGAISMSIDSLGFDASDLKKVKSAVDAPQGMVLVTGPTGSGKTTTQYAALQRINREGINILTAEDPVEYNLDGIAQVHVKEKIGLTFAAALRSFLRQDPEVILVGEIRDKETVDIAIKAALTGHLVLSTLHTNDSVSTITRLLNMGVEPYLISSSLTLIIAQRLARKICLSCKVVDESVTGDMLKTVGFSSEEATRVKTYTGKGCDKCNGRGNKGRRGIYEVLKITDRIKEAILDSSSVFEIQKIAEDEGLVTMKECAKGHLQEGEISFEEFHRVMIV